MQYTCRMGVNNQSQRYVYLHFRIIHAKLHCKTHGVKTRGKSAFDWKAISIHILPNVYFELTLQDGQVIECSQVSDVRKGSAPKVLYVAFFCFSDSSLWLLNIVSARLITQVTTVTCCSLLLRIGCCRVAQQISLCNNVWQKCYLLLHSKVARQKLIVCHQSNILFSVV